MGAKTIQAGWIQCMEMLLALRGVALIATLRVRVIPTLMLSKRRAHARVVSAAVFAPVTLFHARHGSAEMCLDPTLNSKGKTFHSKYHQTQVVEQYFLSPTYAATEAIRHNGKSVKCLAISKSHISSFQHLRQEQSQVCG